MKVEETVFKFCLDVIQVDDDDEKIGTVELYSIFQNWCIWNRISACNKIYFMRTIYKSFPSASVLVVKKNRKQYRFITGISLKIGKGNIYMDEFIKALSLAIQIVARDKSKAVPIWGAFNGIELVIDVRQPTKEDIAKRDAAMKNGIVEAKNEEKINPVDDANKVLSVAPN